MQENIEQILNDLKEILVTLWKNFEEIFGKWIMATFIKKIF